MNVNWQSAGIFLIPAISFILTVVGVPIAGRLAKRWNCIAVPSHERWHSAPTPTCGGLAFFFSVLLVALFSVSDLSSILPFFGIVGGMFFIGVYDDVHQLRPATKLLSQIIAASTALFFDYHLRFFSWGVLDALLTAVWIVGLTNALNLLDNMDGLAAGIGLIAALYLAYLFSQQGDQNYLVVSLALAGALAGFLLFNFHPASIFMGDAGSLFLGTSLSLLTVHANGQASNILSLVAVPACILLVPILDTTLVTVTRLFRGQRISQGGKDHASHRLVVLGLSESQAVLLLYVMALIAGATAVLIKQFAYAVSLAILPLVILTFTLFTAYLGKVEIVSHKEDLRLRPNRKVTILLTALAYKGRMMEILLDLVLIAFAYYLAFALRFEFTFRPSLLTLYISSFPVVAAATYLAFFFLRIYQGLWGRAGFHDLVRIAAAVLLGALLTVAALVLFYGFAGYSKAVFILYSLLLFIGMAGSRLSFPLFGYFMSRPRPDQVPVLVYGAGDDGEVVVRVCRENPQVGYHPVGFLDDDPRKEGRSVLGLRIFGGPEKLPQIIERNQVRGCIISSRDILADDHAQRIRSLCAKQGLWLKQLRFEFIEEGAGKL